MGTMGFLLATIAQGIKTAMATGTDIPPTIISKKNTVYETINTKMVRLSNELETIADMLADDFRGIGTRECSGIIRDYITEYRQSAGIFYANPAPSLPNEPPIKVNEVNINRNIATLITTREAHTDMSKRLNTEADSMEWQGEDAAMARIRWNMIAGPRSNTQYITDCMEVYIQTMQKTLAYYTEAQETTAGPQGTPMVVRIRKLDSIADWIDQVYRETLPHIEDATGLNRIVSSIVPRPGQPVPAILQPGERTRLLNISRIQLDRLQRVRQTLLNTAEAFREAGKKAEAARQEFLRFCYDRHPVGFDYD
ncbi:MAG: hypothetical protein FWG40_12670, partial [Peptococcaceae bacterium]|nr:hypothetical protein [Peptococcaceae bacterium]